jgi:hypothetical protein
MNLFEIVKYGVSCREAAERYGVEVNHYGMALCSSHNDRHPSLYVADGKLDELRQRLEEIHKEDENDNNTADVA